VIGQVGRMKYVETCLIFIGKRAGKAE